VFDGFATLEVSLYYLWHVLLYDTEIPGAPRVDDHVRAMLTEAEAVHRVHSYVPVHALRAQPVLERFADGLGSALLAVAVLADEHVGVVVPDLSGRLGQRTFLLRFLLCLLTSLRDGSSGSDAGLRRAGATYDTFGRFEYITLGGGTVSWVV
jgi:hypothetical protein